MFVPSRPAFLSCLLVLAAAAPCAAQSGSFGNAVVIGEDELIIGEPNTFFRPGTVYVYRRSGDEWLEASQLRAPEAERADGFGGVLAATGTTLFVAQRGGRIHVFRREGETWLPSGVLSTQGIAGVDPRCDEYGYCGTDFGLTLAATDDWLLVGEPGRAPVTGGRGGRGGGRGGPPQEGRSGVVHVFGRGVDGAWSQRESLRPDGSFAGDLFGRAIALEGDRALIGAPGWNVTAGEVATERAGRVFEYRLASGDGWRHSAIVEPRPEAEAGFGSAIAVQGDAAVIGAPGSGDGQGAAHLYRLDPSDGAWSERSRILVVAEGQRGDRFGNAVGLDGRDVWVGAPTPRGTEAGTVYVYDGALDAVTASPRRIRLTETVTLDGFGDRLTAHAGVVAVTASGMHHRSGAVQVYERNAAGEWQDRGRLVSPPDALDALTGEERKCTDGRIGPFDCQDVELLAFIPSSMLRAPEHARGVRTNDNWGWTDAETGREYALVGRNDGTSFVDITDPTNPVLVGDLPKTPNTPPSQLWRDMKVYNDHVFIVADGAGNHGMQVFDLRRLRDVPRKPALFEPDVHYPLVASVHNIAINEETGFAYLVGSRGGGETCGGGLHMVDIREPLNPTFAGCFLQERGTHDVQCAVYRGPDERYHGREICLKSNASLFAISDVSDKANPVAVGSATHPNPAYLHQGWLTEDHHYFIMDDESDVIQGNVETTRTLIWDLSDLEDPVLAKEFMGSMPASAHNLYVKGNHAYQANYRYGLHVLDITDPVNPREVGHFDTTPYNTGPGFSGAWSTFPFFDSGTVIVTSVQEGLFVLKKRDSQVL